MTKRFSALAVSAAIVGGLFITSVPAHAAASADRGAVSAKASVTCNQDQLRRQITELKRKAAKLKQLGEDAAARKALNEAAALQKRLDACRKAEEDASKPFPG
jgi:NAD(P)H-dependent flavin oxidoreductase YrpB (nitropropane dioxygenase family)